MKRLLAGEEIGGDDFWSKGMGGEVFEEVEKGECTYFEHRFAQSSDLTSWSAIPFKPQCVRNRFGLANAQIFKF